MTFATRKRYELDVKLESLEREFAAWRQRTSQGGELEKHHSQVTRLTAQLGGLAAVIGERLAALDAASGGPLAGALGLERMILDVHRIWEFFRSKLVQREVEHFRDYLALADDLAWACYAPARDRAVQAATVAGAAVKEPPLVFLNGASSPFTMARNVAYHPENVPYEGLSTARFAEVLRSLPIPVVGVPWFQVEHLPDVLVIAHEIGHAVEDDLGLHARLRRLLDGALGGTPAGAHQDAWYAWAGEVFADVYGTVALGPAFAGALMDFLAGDPRTVAEQRLTAPGWGDYPTNALRILVVIETLAAAGFKDASRHARDEWLAAYPAHAMSAFGADTGAVARAFVCGPYPELGDSPAEPGRGARLTDVVGFPAVAHAAARAEAANILAGYVLRTADVRQLVAAARLAFEQDPLQYQARAGRVLEHARANRADGMRAAGAGLAVGDGDREAGERLVGLIEA